MRAHNLTRELQMMTFKSQRKDTAKRSALWEFLALGTLRQRLIHRAGVLTRPQGRLTLRMSANDIEKEDFVAYLQVIAPDALRDAA